MSYEQDGDFAELVQRQVSEARQAQRETPKTLVELVEKWRLGLAATAAQREAIERQAEIQAEKSARPIRELGRVFASTLIENGVSFDSRPYQYPYQGSRRHGRRPKTSLPAGYPAWQVTKQQYTYADSGWRNTQYGGDERYEHEVIHSRGLAVAQDGRFMVDGAMGKRSDSLLGGRPWRTVDVPVRSPILVSSLATSSELLQAPGLPIESKHRGDFVDRMGLDALLAMPVEEASSQVEPDLDTLYESWRSHLITVAARIIVAQLSD